jgi:hypothetical protein
MPKEVKYNERLQFKNYDDCVVVYGGHPSKEPRFTIDAFLDVIRGVNVDEGGLLVPCPEACMRFEKFIAESEE